MKKLILLLGMILIVGYSFGQATAVGEFRVAAKSTNYGVNLPIGSKVYCIADSTYWVLTAPAVSTADLNDGGCIQLNPDGTIDTDNQNLTYDADTRMLSITDGTGALIVTQPVVNGDTSLSNSDQIYDFVTGLGYLTAEVDGSISNEGALDVENVAPGGGMTSARITSNTSGSPKVTLKSVNNFIDISSINDTIMFEIDAGNLPYNKTMTDVFEQSDNTADSLTLSVIAPGLVSEHEMTVSLNGYELETDQFYTRFGITSTKVILQIPVYQYDRVVINYNISD